MIFNRSWDRLPKPGTLESQITTCIEVDCDEDKDLIFRIIQILDLTIPVPHLYMDNASFSHCNIFECFVLYCCGTPQSYELLKKQKTNYKFSENC